MRQLKYLLLLGVFCFKISANQAQGLISGLLDVCSASSSTYNVQGHSGYTFTWNISGGSIQSGQGTDSIRINWLRNSSGMVAVAAKEISTGKMLYDTAWINIDTSCVWPGDANHDHIVSYTDILAIGEAYNYRHTQCTDTSTQWEAIARCKWQDTIGLGINMKHIDCNGDGVINALDTVAISRNYGLATNKAEQPCPPGIPTDPVLWIYTGMSKLHPGDSVHADIIFGSSTAPVTGAYGLGFCIHYDPEIIDAGSIKADFSQQWFGDSVLIFFKNLPGLGRLDIAITRTNHYTTESFGELMSLRMKTRLDIPSYKTQSKLWIGEFQFVSIVSPLSAINRINDSVAIVGAAGIEGNSRTTLNFSLIPNPASSILNINCPSNISELRIYDILGRIVLDSKPYSISNQVNISSYPTGLYLVKISDKQGNQGIQKLIIR